jgi:hypothetical protein
MSRKIFKAPSEEAREALITFIDDHVSSFTDMKPERAADMLLVALWAEGFKLVPLTKEDEDE